MLNVDSITNSIYNSKTYILSSSECEGAWLVDCGDIERVLDKIGDDMIYGVLLTHVHYDHIYGLPQLKALFPDSRIITNSYGKQALASSKMNLSKYHEDPIEITDCLIFEKNDSEEMDLFSGIKATIYETPGHNPSCLCFSIDDYLFTGDAYIPGVKVVTNLPGGNMEKAKESMSRIINMAIGKIILSGHSQV